MQLPEAYQHRPLAHSLHTHQFKFYSPPLSQRDFRQAVGAFTVSTFLPGTPQVVTATVDGDVLLWDQASAADADGAAASDGAPPAGSTSDRRAVKLVRVSHKGGIGYVGLIDNLLVIGSEDGAVRGADWSAHTHSHTDSLTCPPPTSHAAIRCASLTLASALWHGSRTLMAVV